MYDSIITDILKDRQSKVKEPCYGSRLLNLVKAKIVQDFFDKGASDRYRDAYHSTAWLAKKDLWGNPAIDLDSLSRVVEEKDILNALKEKNVVKTADMMEFLLCSGIQIVTIADEEYPQVLKACPDAPAILYIRSVTPAGLLFENKMFVSIIGTRDPSPYGAEMTRKVITEIKNPKLFGDVVVVSGLALGIDTEAHKAALRSGMPTIAVIANGITDKTYPAMNAGLAEKIATTPGCAIITSFPPDTAAIAINFLLRNRTIAGLGDMTILVESKSMGGGIMTARLAHDYGRKVYAVPGRLDDVRSEGCNALIREGTAKLI